GNGRRRRIESSVPGPSLAAQPAALTMAVSFTESVKPHLTVLPFDYSWATEVTLTADGNLLPGATCAERLKMFLSRDALGLLVDLSLSERRDSLARLPAPEETLGFASGRFQGEIGALCCHDSVSVDAGWGGSLAGVHARIDAAGYGNRPATLDWNSFFRSVGGSFNWN